MPATPKVQIEHRRSNVGTVIRISGTIDESFDGAAFKRDVQGVVVIDLSDVHRITSFGVREWAAAISGLAVPYIGLINCRPAIVSQISMVRGFTGTGELVTLYLPYLCGACGHGFEVHTDVRKSHTNLSAFKVSDEKCPKCGAAAEFDDLPEVYLACVANRPCPAPPPIFDDLAMGNMTATPTTGVHFEKFVEGLWTGLWLEGVLDGKNYFKRVGDGLEGPLVINMSGLRSYTPDGVGRLLEFLAELKVPVVIDCVPLEVAAQLAAHAPASANTSVLGVEATYLCDTHGSVKLIVEPGRLRDISLQCTECGASVVPAFSATLGDAVATTRPGVMSDGLKTLLEAHTQSAQRAPPKVAPTILGPGSLVMQRYHLLDRIGMGGMAEVFRARQTSLGGFEKLVVVKHILPHLARDVTFVDMFLNEARVAARITHPNVVQIFDVGREGANYFITMEYVQGVDLSSALKVRRQCPVATACRIVVSVLWGLDAAHGSVDEQGRANPIVHRDVSPHNVLISMSGDVKLTDFGIAKAVDTISNTPTSVLKGKTAYLAPELVRQGSKVASQPSIDVYAAGLLLYQLVLGRNPFLRASDLETMKAIINDAAPALGSLDPTLPAGLSALAASAIDKDPARRPTARMLAQGLEAQMVAAGLIGGAPQVAAWVAPLSSTVVASRPTVPPSSGDDAETL